MYLKSFQLFLSYTVQNIKKLAPALGLRSLFVVSVTRDLTEFFDVFEYIFWIFLTVQERLMVSAYGQGCENMETCFLGYWEELWNNLVVKRTVRNLPLWHLQDSCQFFVSNMIFLVILFWVGNFYYGTFYRCSLFSLNLSPFSCRFFILYYKYYKSKSGSKTEENI